MTGNAQATVVKNLESDTTSVLEQKLTDIDRKQKDLESKPRNTQTISNTNIRFNSSIQLNTVENGADGLPSIATSSDVLEGFTVTPIKRQRLSDISSILFDYSFFFDTNSLFAPATNFDTAVRTFPVWAYFALVDTSITDYTSYADIVRPLLNFKLGDIVWTEDRTSPAPYFGTFTASPAFRMTKSFDLLETIATRGVYTPTGGLDYRNTNNTNKNDRITSTELEFLKTFPDTNLVLHLAYIDTSGFSVNNKNQTFSLFEFAKFEKQLNLSYFGTLASFDKVSVLS